jgi:hypothetical protein
MDCSHHDPIVKFYWRFLSARAEANRLRRIADGYLTRLGCKSEQYRQAEIPADEARAREDAIRDELLATPASSPAGLLLLVAVLYDVQCFGGAEPDLPGFRNLIAGIRQLCPAEDLAAAERLLALDVVEVAEGWPRALVTGAAAA